MKNDRKKKKTFKMRNWRKMHHKNNKRNKKKTKKRRRKRRKNSNRLFRKDILKKEYGEEYDDELDYDNVDEYGDEYNDEIDYDFDDEFVISNDAYEKIDNEAPHFEQVIFDDNSIHEDNIMPLVPA